MPIIEVELDADIYDTDVSAVSEEQLSILGADGNIPWPVGPEPATVYDKESDTICTSSISPDKKFMIVNIS